jgi:hypothetical protein
MRFVLPALLSAALFVACRVDRPSELPRDEAWVVAVKSCRLPDYEADITHFAHHTWIDVKEGDEAHWKRIEVIGASSGARREPILAVLAHCDRRWDRDVRVLRTITGESAQRIAPRIEAVAKELDAKYRAGYDAWPGPNSNTLLAELARATPELSFVFHHNGVGKDYPGWFDAGWTASKTGVHVDTLPIGFAAALDEGLEVHLLQLTFGVSFFPPRLELPFLPELPFASSLPPPAPEPFGDVMLELTGRPGQGNSTTARLEPKQHRLLLDWDAVGTWVFVDFERGPRSAGGQRVLHVKLRVSSSRGEQDEERDVPFVAERACVLDGFEFDGLRLGLTFEENPDGSMSAYLDERG